MKTSWSVGVVVALAFSVHDSTAARMVAKRVSAHSHFALAALTAEQQQYRKAATKAEAASVCRKQEVKQTINRDKSVDGVVNIPWASVERTAEAGMEDIDRDIKSFNADIDELKAKIAELERVNSYKAMTNSDYAELLEAGLAPLVTFGGASGSAIAHGKAKGCGDQEDRVLDMPFDFPPITECEDAFEAACTAKITGKNVVDIVAFDAYCRAALPQEEFSCQDLCDSFKNKVSKYVGNDSAADLSNTDTVDDLKKQLADKEQALADAEAEKASCARAQEQLTAFRKQLGELSSNYAETSENVVKYNKLLRREQQYLRRQIYILDQKLKLLEKAKAIFAAASEQVRRRAADVERVQAELQKLRDELAAQLKRIAEIEKKINEITEATAAINKFKEHLSVTLANAKSVNIESIHRPLIDGFKIDRERNLAADFDASEEAAAPAMKESVRAVGDYCAQKTTSDALTNPLVVLEGSSKPLNYICTGQDWNNMAAEAQSTVKATLKQVVDILAAEQKNMNDDDYVPVAASQALRETSGEPKGLRHIMAIYGGQSSQFADSYLNPGWTADVKDGSVIATGKMLQLYQKLGQAAEAWQQLLEEAEAKARQLEADIVEKNKELEVVQELLRKAIEAKEVAEKDMNEAQQVYDENKAKKEQIEANVAGHQKTLGETKEAQQALADSLLKEHRERSAALIQILQELQK